MAKKALIGNIQYFSKRTVLNSICSICQKQIRSKNSYYESNNSEDLICNFCYCRITSNYIKEQKDAALNIDVKTTIFVGVKEQHICDGLDNTQSNAYGKFTIKDTNQPLILPIKVCRTCGRITLSGKYYEKHKFQLKNYTFINARTGKPYLELKMSENYNPRLKVNTKREIPNSLSWAASHPFQGGGFSPK